jgi:hypothetical protein
MDVHALQNVRPYVSPLLCAPHDNTIDRGQYPGKTMIVFCVMLLGVENTSNVYGWYIPKRSWELAILKKQN